MGGGKDGKGFVTVVDANARNKIVYPGSFSDAEFYSKQFGEIAEMETKQTKAYSTFAGSKGFFADRVSESTSEVKKVRFTPTDIVYRPFGEITYCIIKNNSIQPPGASKIQYIPKELNETLDKMVEEYNKEQELKSPGVMLDIKSNIDKKDYDVNEDLNHESNDIIVKNPDDTSSDSNEVTSSFIDIMHDQKTEDDEIEDTSQDEHIYKNNTQSTNINTTNISIPILDDNDMDDV